MVLSMAGHTASVTRAGVGDVLDARLEDVEAIELEVKDGLVTTALDSSELLDMGLEDVTPPARVVEGVVEGVVLVVEFEIGVGLDVLFSELVGNSGVSVGMLLCVKFVGNIVVEFAKGVVIATAVVFAVAVVFTGTTVGSGIAVEFARAVTFAKEVILAMIGIEVAFAMAVVFAKVAVIFVTIGKLVTVVPFNTAVTLVTTGKFVIVAFATDVVLATGGRAAEVALAMIVFVKVVELASVSLASRFPRRPGK